MKNFFVILLVLVSFGVFSQTEFTLQTEDNTSSMKSVVDSMAIDSNQINLKNNDIFIEVLGASGIYSLNYQRKLIEFGKVSLKGRVGFSFLYFPDLGSDYTLSFGGAINYQFTYCWGWASLL